MCEHQDHIPVKSNPDDPRPGESLKDISLHAEDHRRWSRRQFISGLGLSLAGTLLSSGGTTVRAYSNSALLHQLSRLESDRILVLIQLSGGNDGLNTVIPVSNDIYYNSRPTLAIPAQDALSLSPELALHPGLEAFVEPWTDGKMGVIQGVGYPDPNLSHFTSTDVWISGSDVGDIQSTGWLGRTLELDVPDFLNDPPERPLAVQLGGGSPQLFQSNSVNMGMSLPNLQLLEKLLNDGKIYDEQSVPPTVYGSELSFVRSVANDSFQYAEAVQDADSAGTNLAEYPVQNGLAENLAVVGRLIRGSLGATIYHVTLGGFDTHAVQSTRHATLMRTLANAVRAFLDDLSADGIDERVIVATFSEFGRRVEQNASGGTDHGTAAPLFVFGGSVHGGFFGQHPSLSDLDVGGNLKFTIDFRSVYATLLVNWLGVDAAATAEILGHSFPMLDIVDSSASVGTDRLPGPVNFRLGHAFPNPFTTTTKIDLGLDHSMSIQLALFDVRGRRIRTILQKILPAGVHRIKIDGHGLTAGTYMVRARTEGRSRTRQIVLLR